MFQGASRELIGILIYMRGLWGMKTNENNCGIFFMCQSLTHHFAVDLWPRLGETVLLVWARPHIHMWKDKRVWFAWFTKKKHTLGCELISSAKIVWCESY